MSKPVNRLRTYEDSVSIITGGASGIGRALGIELAARGGEVVLADLDLERAQEVADGIRASGGRASARALDVSDADAVEKLASDTFERLQRVDYMFNNAGIALNGKFEDYELDHWRRCVEVNLMGVVHGARAAASVMTKQGFGHIVNTASIAGIFPWPSTMPYTTTKHAVVGLSTALRAELAESGLQVSVICPGTILTPMIKNGASRERWVGTYPQDKLDAFFQNARGMEPELFAKKALDRVARNKPIIVLPAGYKLLWWVNRLSPKLAMGISQKIFKVIFDRLGG